MTMSLDALDTLSLVQDTVCVTTGVMRTFVSHRYMSLSVVRVLPAQFTHAMHTTCWLSIAVACCLPYPAPLRTAAANVLQMISLCRPVVVGGTCQQRENSAVRDFFLVVMVVLFSSSN